MLAQQIPADALEQVAPMLFYGFAGLSVIAAWALVLSQNIVRMAVYLLMTLAGVAGLYFMLNAELLAAIQLIVYAGGTLILIIFGVMLTSKNPFLQLKPTGLEFAIGLGLSILMGVLLMFALAYTSFAVPEGKGGVTQVTGLSGYDQVQQIGKALLTLYLVPFEVAAVLLLVVMIGAAYMARRRREEG